MLPCKIWEGRGLGKLGIFKNLLAHLLKLLWPPSSSLWYELILIPQLEDFLEISPPGNISPFSREITSMGEVTSSKKQLIQNPKIALFAEMINDWNIKD